MPVIKVDIGKITAEQKVALIKGLVTVASEVINIPEQAFVTIINEHDLDKIGNGTKTLTEIYGKKE